MSDGPVMLVPMASPISDKEWAEAVNSVLNSSLSSHLKEDVMRELIKMRHPKMMAVPGVNFMDGVETELASQQEGNQG